MTLNDYLLKGWGHSKKGLGHRRHTPLACQFTFTCMVVVLIPGASLLVAIDLTYLSISFLSGYIANVGLSLRE